MSESKVKIKIEAYEDNNFSKPSSDKPSEFVVDINPEKITHQKSIQMNSGKQPQGGGEQSQHQSYAADQLSFDVLIDGTGVFNEVGNTTKLDVNNKVKELIHVLYRMDGKIHKPNYLLVFWGVGDGEHTLKCHCQSINLEYTLFNADGKPLRAKASLSFKEYIDPKLIASETNSPDLTHIKYVRDGDSILHMCDDVYNNPQYYIAVAKANGLSNFRKLKVGTQLVFPPLKR